MKALLTAGLLIVAGCGSAELVTTQGVLVEDETGDYTAESVSAAIALVREYAPAEQALAFDTLDGMTLRIVGAKRVPECKAPNMATGATGCYDIPTRVMWIASRTCDDKKSTLVTLAHELGHALLPDGDPGHLSDPWYAAGGTEYLMAVATCGKP